MSWHTTANLVNPTYGDQHAVERFTPSALFYPTSIAMGKHPQSGSEFGEAYIATGRNGNYPDGPRYAIDVSTVNVGGESSRIPITRARLLPHSSPWIQAAACLVRGVHLNLVGNRH